MRKKWDQITKSFERRINIIVIYFVYYVGKNSSELWKYQIDSNVCKCNHFQSQSICLMKNLDLFKNEFDQNRDLYVYINGKQHRCYLRHCWIHIPLMFLVHLSWIRLRGNRFLSQNVKIIIWQSIKLRV